MVQDLEKLKDEVRKGIKKYGYIKVAAAAGLGSKNTLRGVERDDWNPRSETLERVLAVIRSGALNDTPNDGAAA